jgi:hypothetical protein
MANAEALYRYKGAKRKKSRREREWSGLSESNRHLNLGKIRGVESNALERWHLADLKKPLIGK